MFTNKSRFTFLAMAVVLLMGLLAGCGGTPQPAATLQPEPTNAPTETTLTSPLSEPTATPPAAVLPPNSSPSPTGTPDPNRTPVAIVEAVIEPDREIVSIENVSQVDQDISGWVLFNLEANPVFRFPENTVLKPGERVQVYSAVPESEVPAGAFFWTEEKVWTTFPADILLLNKATRLMFWYVAYGEQ